MAGRVFVVQQTKMKDKKTGELVNKHDLSAAEKFGTLVYLLDAATVPFNPPPVIEELKNKLATYDDDDYLLLVGNPALIGFATAIAADYNGRVKLLQWSGRRDCYVPITADVLEADC